MAKFKFRFNEILELKQEMEHQKKIELANINKKLMEEKEKLNDLESKLEKIFSKMKKELTGIIKINNLNAYYSQIAYYLNIIEQQKIFIKELEKQQNIKKNELIKALQERKAFEILKEKQYVRWKKDLLKKEQAFLDFVGIVKKHNDGAKINEIN